MAEITARTQQGIIKGKTGEDYRGGLYYSFQGIPYAKPPVGPLRFKAPRPPEPWTGVFDATEEGNECYSRHVFLQNIVGSEDCLILNVYTPALPQNSSTSDNLKPVMFWIHGGAFLCGSSKFELYSPDYLLPQDVVLVTVNYRFGLLGFLNFQDPTLGATGNAGLKDIVLALQWVQRNVENFMGDPNNVTIFGESAGGAAVHYLMLSPLGKGLFHRAIAQSGCALNCWARGSNCLPELVRHFNLEGLSEKEVLEKLQKVPVEELFEVQEKLDHNFHAFKPQSIAPTIENISNTQPNLITKNPVDIIASGDYNQVPLLIGYTSREGMLFEALQVDKNNLEVTTDFETVIPHGYNVKHRSNKSKAIAQKIKEFYYGNRQPSIKDMETFHILITDSYFLESIYRAVKLHAKTSSQPVYFYRMSLETSLNFFKKVSNIKLPGACHGDDVGYLFKTFVSPDIEPGSIEEKSIIKFTKLWTNFARFGDPNGQGQDDHLEKTWKPATEDEINFLDIGEELVVGQNPEEERMRFWEEIQKFSSTNSKL